MSMPTPAIATPTLVKTLESRGAPAPEAKAGTSSISGMTAKSWNSETPRKRRANGAPHLPTRLGDFQPRRFGEERGRLGEARRVVAQEPRELGCGHNLLLG